MKKTIFASLLALMFLITSSLAMANGEKVRKGVVDLGSEEVSIKDVKGQLEDGNLPEDGSVEKVVILKEAKKKLVQPAISGEGTVSIADAKKAMKKKGQTVSIADAKKSLSEVKNGAVVTLDQARLALAKKRGLPNVKGEWFRLGKEFSGADTISEIVVKACVKNFTADVLADNALSWEQATHLRAGFEFFVRRDFLKDEFKNVAEAKFRDGDKTIALSKEVAELREQLHAEAAAMEIANQQIATLSEERDGLQIALVEEQQENAALVAVNQEIGNNFDALSVKFQELQAQNAVVVAGNIDKLEMVSCHEPISADEKFVKEAKSWPIWETLSNLIRSFSKDLDDENLSAAVFGKGGGSILLAESAVTSDSYSSDASYCPMRIVDEYPAPSGRTGYRVRTLNFEALDPAKVLTLPAFFQKARSGPVVGRC